jgi:hypothetical protein
MIGLSIWYAWWKREWKTGFWLENLNEGNHLEDLGIDGRMTK